MIPLSPLLLIELDHLVAHFELGFLSIQPRAQIDSLFLSLCVHHRHGSVSSPDLPLRLDTEERERERESKAKKKAAGFSFYFFYFLFLDFIFLERNGK